MRNNYSEIIEILEDDSAIFDLSEVKNYLRITHNHDDNILRNIIAAAIEVAENFTKTHITRKKIYTKLRGRVKHQITLPHSPALLIEKILYKRDKELSKDKYKIIDSGRVIEFTDTHNLYDIEISYIVGVREIGLPKSIRQGILLHIAAIYDNGGFNCDLPPQAKSLYQPFRRIYL